MTMPKRILIADDDQALVRILDIRCRELGLQTILAHDAMNALLLSRQERPDVICLDVNMPLGNGLSVCEMLAGDEAMASIPVIMLTGRTDKETIVRCHAMCAYYVLKSTDVWQRLLLVLRELLDLPSSEVETRPRLAASPPSPSAPLHAARSLHYVMAAIVPDLPESRSDRSETASGA
jgi:DNA-binding response OmpR family regulator